MNGTITWLPATEENIKQIPLDATQSSGDLVLLFKFIPIKNEMDDTHYNTGYIIGGNIFLRNLEKYSEITHFAYINEPE